jgi:RimJ/RimL family protein N-acetyltransferase
MYTDFAYPKTIDFYIDKIITNGNSNNILQFGIRTINCENLNDNNLLIGYVFLKNIEWNNRSAQLEVAIAERDFVNLGLGSEVAQLILDYVFNELNLNRIESCVMSNNIGAIRMFEKAGFSIEGVGREAVFRDGVALDKIYLGILASEWRAKQGEEKEEGLGELDTLDGYEEYDGYDDEGTLED